MTSLSTVPKAIVRRIIGSGICGLIAGQAPKCRQDDLKGGRIRERSTGGYRLTDRERRRAEASGSASTYGRRERELRSFYIYVRDALVVRIPHEYLSGNQAPRSFRPQFGLINGDWLHGLLSGLTPMLTSCCRHTYFPALMLEMSTR